MERIGNSEVEMMGGVTDGQIGRGEVSLCSREVAPFKPPADGSRGNNKSRWPHVFVVVLGLM